LNTVIHKDLPCPKNEVSIRFDSGHGVDRTVDQCPGGVTPEVPILTRLGGLGVRVTGQLTTVIGEVVVEVRHMPEVACRHVGLRIQNVHLMKKIEINTWLHSVATA